MASSCAVLNTRIAISCSSKTEPNQFRQTDDLGLASGGRTPRLATRIFWSGPRCPAVCLRNDCTLGVWLPNVPPGVPGTDVLFNVQQST